MTVDVKNALDHVAAFLAFLGVAVSNIVTIVAGLFAIAWYVHRFRELKKEKMKNGNE